MVPEGPEGVLIPKRAILKIKCKKNEKMSHLIFAVSMKFP